MTEVAGGWLVLTRGVPDPAYFRTIALLIDDTTEIRLRRRDRIVVPVTAGEHVVQAKLEWGSSLATRVDVQVGEYVPIRVRRSSGPSAAKALGAIPFYVLESNRPLYPVDSPDPQTPVSVAAIDQALRHAGDEPRPDTASRRVWALGWANLALSIATIIWGTGHQWLSDTLTALFAGGWILGMALFWSVCGNARYTRGATYLGLLPGVGVLLASLYTRQRQRAFDLNNQSTT